MTSDRKVTEIKIVLVTFTFSHLFFNYFSRFGPRKRIVTLNYLPLRYGFVVIQQLVVARKAILAVVVLFMVTLVDIND